MAGTDDLQPTASIFLRPIGAPIALGFFGLAAATLVVGGFELGWIAKDQQHEVGLVLVTVPFVLELMASILSFLARDGVTGAALGVQATTWGAIGVFFLLSPEGSTSGAVGLLLLASGAHCAIAGVVSGISTLVPGAVVLVTGARFTLTGIHQLSDIEAWQDAAGVVGIALAALAMYAAAALALEDAHGRTVLPVGRRRTGRRAVEGPMSSQLDGVENEAGVRKLL